MIIELIQNHNMTLPYDTEIISINPISKKIAESIQISWKNYSGGSNSKIKILASNQEGVFSIGNEFNIDNNNNTNDAKMLLINPKFKYFMIIYSPDNVTSGELSCAVNFSEVNYAN